jgi:nitrate reductase delta subunit
VNARLATETVPAADRARIFQLASLLLTYPDDELLAAGPDLRAAADGLPQIEEFLDWLLAAAPIEVQRHYVQTFDLRRRSGLYLTYYLHGDTRKRGMALLMLKQRYRAHGLRLADGELPDLLPIVLEFAATVGPGDGEAPLRQHRQGIELLRTALHEAHTPYAEVLDAVCAALPELTHQDRAAIAALAFDGPPVETVGLDAVGLGPDLSPYPTCSSASPAEV